ncbi:galactokinase [candidate division KSB1 bacterium]
MESNNQYLISLIDKYIELFKRRPQVCAKAPGRANVIGEHTDYNNGFVLPFGIDKCIYGCGSKRNDDKIIIHTVDFKDHAEFALNNITSDPFKTWVNYPKGVLSEMIRDGYHLGGFDMIFGGNVPVAAGLSSSAAVEVVTAVLLREVFRINIEDMDLVKLCQNAERNFVGVQCGIMDQFASYMAKKDHTVLLDCRSLDYEYIPFDLRSHSVVLCNTLKKRELVDSEYNSRRTECEKGVEYFYKIDPDINSLRDVELALFEEQKDKLDKSVRKRCEHVIKENARVMDCINALKKNDLVETGKLLLESHYSLKYLYEVSCDELDILIEIGKETSGFLGGRMMGAGFGGCTINIVENTHLDNFCKKVKSEYSKKTSITPEIYICRVEDGAEVIETN